MEYLNRIALRTQSIFSNTVKFKDVWFPFKKQGSRPLKFSNFFDSFIDYLLMYLHREFAHQNGL